MSELKKLFLHPTHFCYSAVLFQHTKLIGAVCMSHDHPLVNKTINSHNIIYWEKCEIREVSSLSFLETTLRKGGNTYNRGTLGTGGRKEVRRAR